jgi:hypothetical protein
MVLRRRDSKETTMKKIVLAVALVAAIATPALAQQGYYNGKHLIEGRNSAVVTNSGTDTSRESLVRAN